MDRTPARLAFRRATGAMSFPILFKSAFGTSFAVLAVFEVVSSLFGHSPGTKEGIAAATLGLVIGSILVIRE